MIYGRFTWGTDVEFGGLALAGYCLEEGKDNYPIEMHCSKRGLLPGDYHWKLMAKENPKMWPSIRDVKTFRASQVQKLPRLWAQSSGKRLSLMSANHNYTREALVLFGTIKSLTYPQNISHSLSLSTLANAKIHMRDLLVLKAVFSSSGGSP